MNTLEDWVGAVRAEFGLERDDSVQKTVLNLTQVAARQVDRLAAPLTAYYLGQAVGRGMPLAETAARIEELARAWQHD